MGDDGVEIAGPKIVEAATPMERIPHWTRVK
jgi:hypothetical protein